MTQPDLPIETAIRDALAALAPEQVEIIDDSARHAGHAGARQGGHYRLQVVAAAFAGKATLARHRMVHEALGELMRCRIHALSVRALTPEESRRNEPAR